MNGRTQDSTGGRTQVKRTDEGVPFWCGVIIRVRMGGRSFCFTSCVGAGKVWRRACDQKLIGGMVFVEVVKVLDGVIIYLPCLINVNWGFVSTTEITCSAAGSDFHWFEVWSTIIQDISPNLKPDSRHHFRPEPLSPDITFVPKVFRDFELKGNFQQFWGFWQIHHLRTKNSSSTLL